MGSRCTTHGRLTWAACLLVPLVTSAQPGSIDGSWNGSFATQAGTQVKAQLKVSGTDGSWLAYFPRTAQALSPCLTREHPVSITEISPGKYRIVIQASKGLVGCNDGYATLTLSPPDTLSGAFADGRSINLERN